MRVLVTGSRTWADRAAVWAALDQVERESAGVGMVVVHGACPTGADRHADAWAARRIRAGAWVGVEPHPADWAGLGKGAGFRRNAEMVELGADLCLTFIDRCRNSRCPRTEAHGSHGAVHCATAAQVAGIPVRHVQVEKAVQ